MNKKDIINVVAEKNGISKKDAEAYINVVFESMTDALGKGEKVEIFGFGNFSVKESSERKGRNPRTGEEMIIPARKSPAFKAAKALKDLVNK